MVEHYLLKMFYWYLLLGNFVICFWINLVFKIAFDTFLVLTWSCLFWVNSVYLTWSACFIKGQYWYLLLGNFVFVFGYLVFKIAFDTCFSFDLICLFWVNSIVILFQQEVLFNWFDIKIFGWTLSIQVVLLISFCFCNLFLNQDFYFWFLVLTWLPVFG